MSIKAIYARPSVASSKGRGLKSCIAAAVVASMMYVDVAAAQPQLEEVVVTARKRSESLQDVPIAITAMQGEKMQDQGQINLESIAPSIPNFSHAEATASSDQIIMRGVGTAGVNVGFEQAVGQVINGFFYGRSRWGRSAFLDIERLEVLKGPQGALIGKNTSAGAINITTKKPTREFESYILGSYDFEASEGFAVEGAVSGPVSDTVAARFAFRTDQRDGWVRNVNTGNDEGMRDDTTARLIVDWDISDTLNAEFFYQYGDFSKEGRNREYSMCNAGTTAAIAAAGFAEDCQFNAERSTIFVFDGEVQEETHETDLDVYGVTLEWDFDNMTLTSLTNYSTYDAVDRWDVDQQPVERVNNEWLEDYKQFSQEIRLGSNGGETFDYILGLYYQTNEIDFDFRTHTADFGPNSASRLNNAMQDTDSLAAFAQVDWYISNAWTLTLGGRYTDEEKNAQVSTFAAELYTENRIPGGVAGGPLGSLGDGNDLSGTRNESDFSPNLSLQYTFGNDQMLYWNLAEGFKGGGFDLMNSSPQAIAINSWEFDGESSQHMEFGGKHSLRDNSLRLNWALFNTEFDDLQVTALDGLTLRQVTTNAASATTRGVELELDWVPTDALAIGLNYAYLDAAYDKFDSAPCYAGQTAAEGCISLPSGGTVQDLSGVQLNYAPEQQATLDVDYTWSLSGALELTAAVQWVYVDDQFLQLDHDPNDYQEAYDKINARISLTSLDAGWSLALVGRNLTDELTANFSNDTGGLGGGPGNHFKFAEELRAVAIQGRWRF